MGFSGRRTTRPSFSTSPPPPPSPPYPYRVHPPAPRGTFIWPSTNSAGKKRGAFRQNARTSNGVPTTIIASSPAKFTTSRASTHLVACREHTRLPASMTLHTHESQPRDSQGIDRTMRNPSTPVEPKEKDPHRADNHPHGRQGRRAPSAPLPALPGPPMPSGSPPRGLRATRAYTAGSDCNRGTETAKNKIGDVFQVQAGLKITTPTHTDRPTKTITNGLDIKYACT